MPAERPPRSTAGSLVVVPVSGMRRQTGAQRREHELRQRREASAGVDHGASRYRRACLACADGHRHQDAPARRKECIRARPRPRSRRLTMARRRCPRGACDAGPVRMRRAVVDGIGRWRVGGASRGAGVRRRVSARCWRRSRCRMRSRGAAGDRARWRIRRRSGRLRPGWSGASCRGEGMVAAATSQAARAVRRARPACVPGRRGRRGDWAAHGADRRRRAVRLARTAAWTAGALRTACGTRSSSRGSPRRA